jgi:hypothetical protein
MLAGELISMNSDTASTGVRTALSTAVISEAALLAPLGHRTLMSPALTTSRE